VRACNSARPLYLEPNMSWLWLVLLICLGGKVEGCVERGYGFD